MFSSNLSAICHIGGYFKINQGAVWKMNTCSFGQNKFYFIKEGRCKITIEGKEYEGIPGRLFFIPAGVLHSYSNDSSATFAKWWIHFDVYPDNSSFFGKLNLPYYTDIKSSARIDKYFRLMSTELKSGMAVDVLNGKAALFNLISDYVEMTNPKMEIGTPSDKIIENIVAFVDDNIERNINLEELAGICHLHPTHFIRWFKKKTGETPAHFVQRRKIETAKRLIEETNLSMNEIMCHVGIIDAAQFSKKFRNFYGNSPNSFRKNINNMNNKNKTKNAFNRRRNKALSGS